MPSQFYESDNDSRIVLTLISIHDTITQLCEWNKLIKSPEDYYNSQNVMQLLAANCTLITAIGEGVNRINRCDPDFLASYFPEIPWRDIIGMRNRLAHGYFELDPEIVFEAVKNDIPQLNSVIVKAIEICRTK